MKTSNSRLSYRIVRSLLFLFVLILLTLGFILKTVMENTLLTSEKQKAELLLQTIEKPLQMALYLKFYDQISQKVSPVVSVRDVTELKISDNDENTLYRYVKKTAVPETMRHNPLTITQRIREPVSGKIIATVMLRYSDHEYDQTRHTMYSILYALSLMVGIIFFVALWWVQRLLSPLGEIALKVRHYKPGDVIVFQEDGSLEIEQIVLAFNAMQQVTHTYLERIKAMNLSLELEVNEKSLELEEQFYTDRLTGLPNRYTLQEKLAKKEVAALAIVNIDDFQEVNDFFGISMGDEVLKQIAGWLNDISGPCYRLGGDEFALTFDEPIDRKVLEEHLLALIKRLEEKTFTVGDQNLNLRITIGSAVGSETLLTQADIALHHAKHDKIPVAFYDQVRGIEEQYRSNLNMAATIRKALMEQRVICYYQPILNIRTGKVDKYETLARMVDEEGRLIPPMDFLPIAKKTKLYPQITLAVVHQACALFSGREESFSINLSDSDIRDAHTVSEIIKTIAETGTSHRVVFEILESEGIENYEEVTRFIARVKSMGAKIAIDDFGTGYSNFENILKLGVDYIKIDGSLIRGIRENRRHRIIVETIVDFTRKIDARTIAEYVEDELTFQTLREIGIDYSQGYFTGKPVPLHS